MVIDNKKLNPFFNKLMEETYIELNSSGIENTRQNLAAYFDKKNELFNIEQEKELKEYLKDNSVCNFELMEIKELAIFRMLANDAIFDFPKNWSIFEELSSGSEDLFVLGKCSDKDFILEVLSQIFGPISTLVINKNKSSNWIYFFEQDEQFVLRDLSQIEISLKQMIVDEKIA